MSERPHFSAGIEDLEALAEAYWNSPEQLAAIAKEMSFRTRRRARALQNRVAERLKELGGDDTTARRADISGQEPSLPMSGANAVQDGGGRDGPRRPVWEDDALFAQIAALYEGSVRIPKNEICRTQCDAKCVRPLLPWHIGDFYSTDPLRLVIVGKPHREDVKTASRAAGTQDGRGTARWLYVTKDWDFWKYTRQIFRNVYGSDDEGWRRTGITTIVKCTNSSPATGWHDQTTNKMKAACVSANRVIQQELKILKPRTIVLYTALDYEDCVADLPWEDDQKWVDSTTQRHRVGCGSTTIPWWDRRLVSNEGHVRFLRTGHPGRKPQEFVDVVTDWLRQVARES